MIKKIFAVFFILLLVACGSKDKKTAIPSNVIPPEQMVQILVDFHLAEAALAKAQQNNQDVNLLSNHYYASILRKYHITRSKFQVSIMFYSSNLKELDNIYKEVLTELSKTQTRIISKKI